MALAVATSGCASRASSTITRAEEIGVTTAPGLDAVPVGCREEHMRAPAGWLYRPTHQDHAPAVVMLHKGFAYDHEQATTATHLLGRTYANHLCARGVAVFAVDYRASALGMDEMRDVDAAYDRLASDPGIDRAHIGLAGGSHGGYMTLLALSQRRRPFASGVVFYGFGDVAAVLARHTLHNPSVTRTEHLLGDPRRSPQSYRAISPMAHLDRITVPVLLISGSRDEFATDMAAVAARLRASHAQVEFHEIDGARHGFEVDQGAATAQLWDLTTAFVGRTLDPPV